MRTSFENWMKRLGLIGSACAVLTLNTGCKTVHDATPAKRETLQAEGSLVFVRPDHYSIIGTRSIRDYVEITYEKAQPNPAGLLTVQAGFRNRGGKHWYDLKGPDYTISVKTAFYAEEVPGKGTSGPPLYETNWQPLPLPRGDTGHYEVTCPVRGARFYQITASEFIKQ